ncbi:MAG TPA: CorA family divalent cation transporter [Solirubrobacterales bacterium]
MDRVVQGLGGEAREAIGAFRSADRFFWLDLTAAEARDGRLGELLGVEEEALAPLLDFGVAATPSKKLHIDGRQVVFGFSCFPEGAVDDDEHGGLRGIDVRVLVHGSFMITVHEEPVALTQDLSVHIPSGRSEQYAVYAVLDSMVATAFDALDGTEAALEGLEVASADIRNARLRMATLRAISRRLAAMRRRIGPQRGVFERIGEEITRVEGIDSDSERYFERIYGQLNRLVEAIDAATGAMAQLVDLRLNETMYWLTVIATIFLPLTFVTGFFGMNFKWLIEGIDTTAAFLTLGVAVPALLAAVTWYWVQRRGNPVEPDDDRVRQFLRTLTQRGLGRPF